MNPLETKNIYNCIIRRFNPRIIGYVGLLLEAYSFVSLSKLITFTTIHSSYSASSAVILAATYIKHIMS